MPAVVARAAFGQVLGNRIASSGGKLEIGGVDATQLPAQSLGRLVGYVDGEPVVFDASLYDNIVYALHEQGLPEVGRGEGTESRHHAAGTDAAATLEDRLLRVLTITGS